MRSMAGPGRAARGRLTEPPCWPRAALRRFLPQCPAPRGGDRRWRRGRAGPRRASGRRFLSPPTVWESGFRRAAPHFRSGPPTGSQLDFRSLLHTSGFSLPPRRTETSARCSALPILLVHCAAAGLPARLTHIRFFPSAAPPIDFRSLLHTSGLSLVRPHRGITVPVTHFRSYRKRSERPAVRFPPLRVLQSRTSGAVIALLGIPWYPDRNKRSASPPHFRFPLLTRYRGSAPRNAASSSSSCLSAALLVRPRCSHGSASGGPTAGLPILPPPSLSEGDFRSLRPPFRSSPSIVSQQNFLLLCHFRSFPPSAFGGLPAPPSSLPVSPSAPRAFPVPPFSFSVLLHSVFYRDFRSIHSHFRYFSVIFFFQGLPVLLPSHPVLFSQGFARTSAPSAFTSGPFLPVLPGLPIPAFQLPLLPVRFRLDFRSSRSNFRSSSLATASQSNFRRTPEVPSFSLPVSASTRKRSAPPSPFPLPTKPTPPIPLPPSVALRCPP